MAPSPDHQRFLDALAQIRRSNAAASQVAFKKWIRIIRDEFRDGLGFSPIARSRFSDPDNKFGVVYVARTFETAVAETIVRDRKDGHAALVLSYEEALESRRAVSISCNEPLQVFDLTGVGLIKHGIPTDVLRGKNQSYSRLLSAAIFGSPTNFDGILYQSRITGADCIVFYDRALPKVRIVEETRLAGIEDAMSDIYRSMNISIRRT